MDKPLVSVVIPFFSRKKGVLLRSVDSALKQTYRNIEVVIIDDNSPVSADEELASVSDPRLRVLRNEENKNGAFSRNRGMSVSLGEYVALLDADDYWDPNHLSLCYEGIGDCDFVYSNIIYVRDGVAEFRAVVDVDDYDLEYASNMLFDGPPQTNSFFFKRQCFPSLKFDESLRRHQDYQFFIDFFLSDYKVRKLDIYTTHYIFDFQAGKVDYPSIIQFWEEHRRRATYKKLNRFILDLVVSGLRARGITRDNLQELHERVIPENKIYMLALKLKSETLLKYLLYFYFFMLVDNSRLIGRFAKLLRKR